MKKLFLSFVVLILSISFVNAVPAYPGLVKKTQPDGTTISFYLRGDEHFSFKMSEDGYLLALNADGVFEYADFRDNSIIPMGVKASDITKRSIEEVDFLQKADNVYRTSDYIVKQKICTTLDEDTLITHLISDDTYYARTQKRDAEYNVIFRERGKEIDGKRIKSSMFTRKYID